MPDIMSWLVPVGIGLIAIIAIIIFLLKIYRVADVDKALVITGGNKPPRIKVSGGGFVIPIFRKASFFDLCMLTIPADSDEIKTLTKVPIVVDWTAQIRPEAEDVDILRKAVVSFKERGQRGIIEDVKLTLMGAVRGVVATLTPEQVQNDKESFKSAIIENVSDELQEMGLRLISLNIQEVTDKNGYFDDMAAKDREEKRRDAEKVKAAADQAIREQVAESEKLAAQKELETELEIAEKTKDNNLKKATFKMETDKANADAEVAGELQKTIREQEVAEQQGKVEVVRQEQANLAAIKKKEVIKTEAEAERVKAEIKAEEKATVAKTEAKAKAEVAKTEALGEAEAIKVKAEATANEKKLIGETEAEIIAKQGAAEAEKEKAILLAKAEGEKALAEARAGNDKVNFEIEKIKLETEAKIQIATNMATVMAEVGKNAEFVNIGGQGTGAGGNVLIDTLSQIPSLLKTLDVENNALNGKSMNDSIKEVVSAIAEPLKGLGLMATNNSTETTVVNGDTKFESTDVPKAIESSNE